MLKFDSKIDKTSALKSIRNAGITSVLVSLSYAFEIIGILLTPPAAFTLGALFSILAILFFFYLNYRIFLGKRMAMIIFFLITFLIVSVTVFFTEERLGSINFLLSCMLGYFLLKGIEAAFWLKKQPLTSHSSGTPSGVP